ncbi:MAG: transcription elongation factor GreA [Clostridia bacterium]|nr:transcription elongation factor GreA [Clostridia bacterium]
MPDQQFAMTKENLDSLKKQLDELVKVKRPQIIERITEARGHGDLSENAEYDAARDEQRSNEGKIAELEYKIKNAVIIETPKDNKEVNINSIVKVHEMDSGEDVEYTITSVTDLNVEENKYTAQSPLGMALLGHKVNETVTVFCPNGSSYDLRIDEISILSSVTVVDKKTGGEVEYTITSDENYEGMNSKVSSDSELGKILKGQQEGDFITVPGVKNKGKKGGNKEEIPEEDEVKTEVSGEENPEAMGENFAETAEAPTAAPKGKERKKRGERPEVLIRIKSIG